MRAFFLALSLVVGASSVNAEPIRNSDVINLAKSGLSDEAIIALIRANPNAFSISPDDLISMKKNGVSNAVISEIISAKSGNRPVDSAQLVSPPQNSATALAPGFYYAQSGSNPPAPQMISPNYVNSARMRGAAASGFTMGLGKIRLYSELSGEHADIATDNPRPEFLLSLDAVNNGLNSGGQALRSPDDLVFSKFELRKGNREFFVGQGNRFGTRGLTKQDSLPFISERVSDKVYRIRFSSDLEPGEYGFLNAAANNGQSTGTLVAFAFSVK